MTWDFIESKQNKNAKKWLMDVAGQQNVNNAA